MDRHADRAAALAGLRARWGAAAPRPAVEVFGALAAAPLPAEAGAAPALPGSPGERPRPGRPGELPQPVRPALVPLPGGALAGAAAGSPAGAPAPGAWPLPGARPFPAGSARDADRVISTGFPELDALLAAGGLPRAGTVALRGTGSSGATTLALRAVAEAQAGGALVAWVDLARSLDPVEAVARGVRLEWLAVLAPASTGEALAMAGALLQARAVDLLVLDLAGARGGPAGDRVPAEGPADARGRPATPAAQPAAPRTPRTPRQPRPADQLARLVAFARHTGALLLVLEPADTPAPLRAALEEGAGLRLELCRRGWIRLGREVVGQRTEVRVARDHHGAPDRRTAIRLLYAEGGPRDRCLARDDLLDEAVAETGTAPVARTLAPPVAPTAVPALVPAPALAAPPLVAVPSTLPEPQESTDAPPPPRLAPSRSPARAAARPRHPDRRAADPRRAAVG